MKSVSIVTAAVLASVVVAQPHGKHHQHQAHHHKREGPPVVWVTDYDIVTETVGYTTTIWVSEGFVPPEPSTLPTSSASETQVPAQFFEPIPPPSSHPPAPSSSSSSAPVVVVAPPPAVSTPVQPTSVVAFVAPPIVQSSSSPAAVSSTPVPTPEPVIVAPPAPTTPAYVAPVQSSTPVPAPAPVASPESSLSSGTTTGSTTADCSSESNACSGDITHYDTGMGACGWPNVSTDKVIALPFEFMGTQSNGNPFCGKTVTISLNGKTTTAEVVDKCMGCYGRSIDLSDGAFKDLADMDLGRVHDVVWWFN